MAQRMSPPLLSLMDQGKSPHVLIQEGISLVFESLGCAAVGVRLRQGSAFPFFQTRGLPDSFVYDKRRSCLISRQNQADDCSKCPVVSGCLCSQVIWRQIDPSQPCFTAHGSFWTNSLGLLINASNAPANGLAGPMGADSREGQGCGMRCHEAGFQSMTLLPLCQGGMPLGLLQIGDSRKNFFAREDVAWLEHLAANLSAGLALQNAARALHQSEARYQTMIETLAEGVILQDAAGRIVTWNRVAETLFGLSELRLKDVDIIELDLGIIDARGRPFSKAAYPLVRTLRTGEPCTDVVMGVPDQKGSYRWINVNTRPIFKSSAALPDEVVISFSEITEKMAAEKERQNLEAQLQQAQKMEAVGTLAGGIAHDFNNILASILGYTELAVELVENGSELHQNLGEVLTAGNRARHLVDQILAISRQQKQEKADVNINPLIKEAMKMLRSTLPSSIALKENICRQALVVNADATQIHQVIVNLATNAKQAMPDQKGELEIRAEPEHLGEQRCRRFPDLRAGPYARITVSDNGPGIAEDHLEKIFEPYFTTKKKGEGTGLGLSVVHGIVKAHQGHIHVESTPGRRTHFYIYLPLTDRPAAGAEVQAAPETLARGDERIMVVDDETPIVKMLTRHLKSLGYTVSAYTQSRAAGEAFQAAPDQYDLVVTDMTMPELTGDQLAGQIKAVRDIPVILCTGFSEAVEAREAELLVDRLLMKPLDKKALAAAVRGALDRSPESDTHY